MKNLTTTAGGLHINYQTPLNNKEKRLEKSLKYLQSKRRDISDDVLEALKIASGV